MGFAQQLQVKEKSSVKVGPKDERETIGHPAAFSPDGKTLASHTFLSGTHMLVLHDAATGERVAKKDYSGEMIALTFNADGTLLAVGTSRGISTSSARDGFDAGTVTLWDMKTRKQSAILRLLGAAPFGLAFSPDGKALATSAAWGVSIWEVDTGKERAHLCHYDRYMKSCSWLAYSPDGKILCAEGGAFWNVDTEELWPPQRLPAIGHPKPDHIAFSPDSKTLVGSFRGSRAEGVGRAIRQGEGDTRRDVE